VRSVTCVLAPLLAVALALAAPATAGDVRVHTLAGPDVYPEGVAVEQGTDRFYVSSNENGTIYRGALGRTKTSVFLPPGGNGRSAANGITIGGGRLFVAGLTTGYVFAYDLRTKKLLRRWDTRDGAPARINDVAMTPAGDVYATDSERSLLFRVPASATRGGSPRTLKVKPWLKLRGTIVPTGQPFNVNGIVSSTDGRYLLVVHTSSSRLFRIDTRTKAIAEVKLDQPATVGDGLVLRGRTLYVISVAGVLKYRLATDLSSGKRLSTTTDPSFRFPTTGAALGDRLLVVNSQFDRRGSAQGPELPFTVSDLPLP
jgi:Cu-Zn family superoxide dismutase